MLHRGMLQPRRLLPHLRPSDLHVVYEVSRRPPLTPIGLRPFRALAVLTVGGQTWTLKTTIE